MSPRLDVRSYRGAQQVQTALRVFDAAMARASSENLWLLHGGLEKLSTPIVRGGWGGTNRKACPLTALYVGVPTDEADAKRAGLLATEHLRSLGLAAADFYEPWDRGWISARRLLRVVDAELTRRTFAR